MASENFFNVFLGHSCTRCENQAFMTFKGTHVTRLRNDLASVHSIC